MVACLPWGLDRKLVSVVIQQRFNTPWLACAGVREAGAAIKCLQLFLRFPFNNLLHHQARACLCNLQKKLRYAVPQQLAKLSGTISFARTRLVGIVTI